MTWHLVRDAVRRYRPAYLVFGSFLAVQWMIAAGFWPTTTLAFSLAVASVLGVFAGVSVFSTPVIGLLPIPRATLWRAQWIVSTVVATIWTTAAKLTGVLIAAPFGRSLDLPFIALSSCLDFFYNGVLLGVIVVTRVTTGPPRADASIVMKSVQAFGMIVGLLGGLAWGFVLRPILPPSWAQVTGNTALVMGAALVVCLATLFYRPPADAPRPALARRETGRHRVDPRSVRPGRLVGLRRLIADDFSSTAWVFAVWPAMAAVVSLMKLAFNPGEGAGVALEAPKQLGLLPLRDDASFAQCWFLLYMGFVLINHRRLSGADPVSPFMRQLRVLPVSARQLNALLVGRRLLGWIVVWLFLLIFHAILFRSAPTTLRPDILLWVAGADALAYAFLLCWMRWLPIFAFVAIFGLVSGLGIDAFSADLAPFAGSAIGLASLAAAIWINHVTLNLRQEPYRPVPEPTFAKWYAVR
jgi:hypothetical protein